MVRLSKTKNIGLRYVLPPVISGQIVFRRELCEELHKHRNSSLIVLNTSAGYGKTVLLKDYTSRFLKNVCWLNSPGNITTSAELTMYLIYSLRQINTKFGIQLESYLSLSNNESAGIDKDLPMLLMNEFINSFDEEVTLVIDDFQNIESDENLKWAAEYFDELLSLVPVNLKFIIATRQKPCFKTSRLEAKRDIFVLYTENLKFDQKEITYLIENLYTKEASHSFVKLLYEKTGGWITGLHLLLQSSPDHLDNDLTGSPDKFYEFFAEDVFNALEPEIQNFLLSTAILESFDADICSKLLGISDTGSLIEKVVSKNIFADTFYDDKRKYYSYQKLFHDFLKLHVKKVLSPEQLSVLFLKAAAIYHANEDHENAICCYIKAGNISAALDLFYQDFGNLFEGSEFNILKRRMDLLPDKAIETNAKILYAGLKLGIAANDHSITSSERFDLLNKLSESDSRELKISVKILEAEYILVSGNIAESLKILQKLNPGVLTDYQLAEYYALLIKVYYRMGFSFYEKIEGISDTAIESAERAGSGRLKLDMIGNLAIINYDRGLKHLAIKYLEQTLEIKKSINIHFKYLTILITLHSDTGNFERSTEYLNLAEELFRKYPTPLMERLLLKSVSKFYFNLGDFDSCIRILEELVQKKSIKENRLLYLSNILSIAEAHYFNDNKELAKQTFELSQKVLNSSDDYFIELGKIFTHYYLESDLSTNETETALLSSLEYHRSNNILTSVPQLEFYLSNHYLISGKPETAIKYLRPALAAMEQKDEVIWCKNELFISRQVFDFALASGINKRFIAKIVRYSREKLDCSRLTPEFKKKAEDRADKLTDINFSPFGSTSFSLRGENIADDKWIRKKSKILLAYLMTDPEKIHTKDKTMDLFFDDAPADKADMVYHSTLYNIRTALKIYEIKSDKPKRSKDKTFDYNPQYILYEDKTLRLNPDFYYRADNVEFEKHYDKSRLPSLSNEEKISHSVNAARLYKGDFLPGYYDSWAEELRIKYKNMYISLLEELVKLLESEDRYEEAVKYSELLLSEDKLNDSIHVSIINAYQKLGNANMAKSRFELMLKIYDEELGEKPYPKTLEKINHILCAAKNL